MSLLYSEKILKKLESGKSAIQIIKGIMLQSTGDAGNNSSNFYDDIDQKPTKEFAHYIVDQDQVVKYDYSDSTVFVRDMTYTDNAINLFTDKTDVTDKVGSHMIVIEITLPLDANDYTKVETNLIKFLADVLRKHGLVTDNVWRYNDIVSSPTNRLQQYSAAATIGSPISPWQTLLNGINLYIEELKKPTPNLDDVSLSGAVVPVSNQTFEMDQRNIKAVKSIPSSDFYEEDYTVTTTASIETIKDNFTGKITTKGSGDEKFEPIYPDLSVPPTNSTVLYNEVVGGPETVLGGQKHTFGKIVNNLDPYPVDDKIVELEEHFPSVKLEDSAINSNDLASYLVTISRRAEQRLVQIENILATHMRYLHRLSSRMNVNCVFYGGQTQFNKYACIRCLQDDMINDGQAVTIDQCLNCARYEPIIGQFYEILNEDLNPDLAPILDDMQMARMTPEEYIKFTRIEKMVDENDDASCKKDELNKKQSLDKTFYETMEKEDTYRIDWTETTFDAQIPDVNEYEYNVDKFRKNKEELFKPENRYKDYYKNVKKKEIIPRRSDIGGSYSAQYDWSNAKVREAIVNTAKEFVALGKQGKALYVFGGKITESYFSKTPAEIYAMLPNTQPCYAVANDPVHSDAISIDCSGFVRYCYKHNKVDLPDGTFDQVKKGELVGAEQSFDKSIQQAYPGDIIFYADANRGVYHVTLYMGNNEMAEAYSSHVANTEQVRIAPARKENFHSIRRLSELAIPVIKSSMADNISYTLNEMINLQKPRSTGPNGGDHEPVTEEQIKHYLDPTNFVKEPHMYQFMKLSVYCGTTEQQMKDFLKKRGATQLLIDSASAYITACKQYNINELYLLVHSLLESGNGKSPLSSGGMLGPKTGKPIYNLYGYKAYNNDSARIAARSIAEDEGWFDTAAGIIGGAKHIGNEYIHAGQDTLYKMRFNSKNLEHQYATDVSWASKQAEALGEILKDLPKEVKDKIIYEVPTYKV